MTEPSAEYDAPPEWCPRRDYAEPSCLYPECLLLVDRCGSAFMASGPRQEFPEVEPRRPRRVIPPGRGNDGIEG